MLLNWRLLIIESARFARDGDGNRVGCGQEGFFDGRSRRVKLLARSIASKVASGAVQNGYVDKVGTGY